MSASNSPDRAEHRAQGYVICTNPRSGSTLLCQMLTDTGIAGVPKSYFHRPDIRAWAKAVDLHTDASAHDGAVLDRVLPAVLRAGRSDNGVFGLRLQHKSLDFLLASLRRRSASPMREAALLEAALGPLRYIHLRRADKLAEAVSLVRAEQSGLWHRAPDGRELERTADPVPPRFDAGRIAGALSELTARDRAWTDWFVAQEITPIPVLYEDLAADPIGVVGRLLGHLGLDPAAVRGVTPGVAPLSDDINRDWIARFLREGGADPGN